jgi:hypothetical protein
MATAVRTPKSPFIPRSCEKIRSWFDRLTTRGREQWNFRYLAARPEPVEGQRLIFSQLPLLQRGNSLRYRFNPSLRKFEKEGKGRFLAATVHKLFNEFQIRHASSYDRYSFKPSFGARHERTILCGLGVLARWLSIGNNNLAQSRKARQGRKFGQMTTHA